LTVSPVQLDFLLGDGHVCMMIDLVREVSLATVGHGRHGFAVSKTSCGEDGVLLF
jgi:hypothetical protein